MLSFRVFLQSFKYRSGSFCHLFDIFPGLFTTSLPSFQVFLPSFCCLSVIFCRLDSIVLVFLPSLCHLSLSFCRPFAIYLGFLSPLCHLPGLFAVFLSGRSFCRLFPIFPGLFVAFFRMTWSLQPQRVFLPSVCVPICCAQRIFGRVFRSYRESSKKASACKYSKYVNIFIYPSKI